MAVPYKPATNTTTTVTPLPNTSALNIDDKVNDVEVARIIRHVLNHEVEGAKITDRVYQAFRILQERRRTVAPTDFNLAAAEHYMFARHLAGTTGDPAVLAAPSLYALKKAIFFKMGKEKELRTTPNNPSLPPSVDSLRWGMGGVTDGIADFAGENPALGWQYGAAVPQLVKEALRKK